MKIIKAFKANKTIILVVTILTVVFIIILRRKKQQANETGTTHVGNKTDTSNTPITAFNKLKAEFAGDTEKLKLLNTAERIYRLESNHFDSNIYKKTNGAGVIAVKKTYPFGWVLPQETWEKHGKPSSVYSSSNGNDYIIFPTIENGIRTTMSIIQGYHNQGYSTGRYLSATDTGKQQDYVNKLNNIKENRLFTESFEDNNYLIHN